MHVVAETKLGILSLSIRFCYAVYILMLQ